MKSLSYLAIITTLTLISCSPQLRSLTKSLYVNSGLTESELGNLQFYLSEEVTLYRRSQSKKSAIENGSIKIVKGQQIEEVVFPKGTPGLFVNKIDGDKLAISFDSNQDAILIFGPNPKYSDRYVVLAKDWKNGIGKITYGSNNFNITAQSATAGLLLDIKHLDQSSRSRTTVQGNRLDD